ncbi:MAG: membrane protein insertase YidC [Ghiorsea sp.]|nr:membrane protein insertase YidC [Ghiorsea sp.]
MDNKNLILAFALSMGVLFGWSWMFPPVEPVQQVEQTENRNTETANNQAGQNSTAISSTTETSIQGENPTTQVVTSESIQTFGNDVLELTINAKGWLTDAVLLNYQESLDNPEKIKPLSSGDFHEAYINSGVVGQTLAEPFKLTSLNESHDKTTATFEAKLSDGYTWQRTYTLEKGSYLVNVKDRIKDGAGLKLYRQVVEKNPLEAAAENYNEHIGPIGLFNDELTEVSYDDLDEMGAKKLAAMGGWTGMMTRYFISAIYGTDQDESYRYYYKGDGRSYQAGMINDGMVEQGDMVFDNNMYIGPKSVPLLEKLHVGLERSVDFGWFTVIAKPLHEVMLWLNQYISNFGVIIILMVITIKIILFIPTQGAYRSMAAMRKLQPEMVRLKDRYGDDRAKMGQEVMAMYKKNKVNPLGGCLPILMQMPIFFALYKVLLISIELRQAPFYGWIEDMSVQDPFFVLPILMGISMYIQMKLNPQPTDPIQAKVMQFLPIMMTALFLFFPAGLVLYWVVNNVLSIIQQRLVMKSMNVD